MTTRALRRPLTRRARRPLPLQRLAHKLHERAVALQRAGALPPRETCDLVVVDRSIDPVGVWFAAAAWQCRLGDAGTPQCIKSRSPG